jgi:AraC-like DNA-binding protein
MNTVSAPKASGCLNEHCLPSLKKIGFQFYQEQNFERGLVSLPAFTGIRISYLHKGISQREGTLCAGDMLISGFTSPLYGEVNDFSMASIGLHFTLLYRLTGITPKDCRIPFKIASADSLYTLLLPLFFLPQEEWEKLSFSAMQQTENKLSRALIRQMERVDFATKEYHRCRQLSFQVIASQMGISYRQLQRDFSMFLGITPTEYERADRFKRAVKHLKDLSPVQASIVAGYWDQAHMIKEFKELSGRTPSQIIQLEDIKLPQLHGIQLIT